MSQPAWKYIANLGDASPVDHGGYFLYEDTTGVYGFEAEYLETPPDAVDPDDDDAKWTVHRACLDKLKMVKGYMVSDKYKADWPHPLHSYIEWFDDSLPGIADCMGTTEQELRDALCSDDGKARAWAYRCIADYHGWDNLDSYPLTLTKAEVEARYTDGEL